MQSFIEYVIQTTEARDDEKASKARAGGPGSVEQEKQRHGQQVNREIARHHRRKARGFQSDQEEKAERDRHKLARSSEQRRHKRSVQVSHAKEEKAPSLKGSTTMADAFQKALDRKLLQQDEGMFSDPIIKATKKAIEKHKAKKEFQKINPQSKRKRLYHKPDDSPKQKARVDKNKAQRRKENRKELGVSHRATFKRRLKGVAKSAKKAHSGQFDLLKDIGITK